MINKTKPAKDFVWENSLTVNVKTFNRGGGSALRIGRWIVDGVPSAYQIERREFYDNEGGRVFRKAKGLTYEDAKYIALNWDDIEHLMLGKRPLIELAIDAPLNAASADF